MNRHMNKRTFPITLWRLGALTFVRRRPLDPRGVCQPGAVNTGGPAAANRLFACVMARCLAWSCVVHGQSLGGCCAECGAGGRYREALSRCSRCWSIDEFRAHGWPERRSRDQGWCPGRSGSDWMLRAANFAVPVNARTSLRWCAIAIHTNRGRCGPVHPSAHSGCKRAVGSSRTLVLHTRHGLVPSPLVLEIRPRTQSRVGDPARSSVRIALRP